MCHDRKLEGVGVAWNVAGIHFGWDSVDHFGNSTEYDWDLPIGLCNDATAAISIIDGRVVATHAAHRTSR